MGVMGVMGVYVIIHTIYKHSSQQASKCRTGTYSIYVTIPNILMVGHGKMCFLFFFPVIWVSLLWDHQRLCGSVSVSLNWSQVIYVILIGLSDDEMTIDDSLKWIQKRLSVVSSACAAWPHFSSKLAQLWNSSADSQFHWRKELCHRTGELGDLIIKLGPNKVRTVAISLVTTCLIFLSVFHNT
jgi:hypothetical protein